MDLPWASGQMAGVLQRLRTAAPEPIRAWKEAAEKLRGSRHTTVHVGEKDTIENACKRLTRQLREEGDLQKITARPFRLEPCQQRRLQRKEAQLRLRNRSFKYKLRWIFQRRERGF